MPADNNQPSAPPVKSTEISLVTPAVNSVDRLDRLKQAFMNNQLSATRYEQTTQQLTELKQSFIKQHITAVQYEQAEQQLFAQVYSSAQSAYQPHQQPPQQISATRNSLSPTPDFRTEQQQLVQQITATQNSLSPTLQSTPQLDLELDESDWDRQQQVLSRSVEYTENTCPCPVKIVTSSVIDRVLTIEYPLPIEAYIFMCPFPFFCIGCCIKKGSKLVFDDNTRQLTIEIYRSLKSPFTGRRCCGTKHWIGSYDEIISFETNRYSPRQRETKVKVRDGRDISEYLLGNMSVENHGHQARQLNWFIKSRQNEILNKINQSVRDR